MSIRLSPPDAPAPADLAAALASRLVCTPDRWRDLVQHEAGGRGYVALPDLVGAEAWVITWAPGTGLDRHDHGGAAGAMVVVEGTLVEHHGRTWAPGRFRRRVLDKGSLVSFGADHIHDVRNTGVSPAVSLHVYAPALATMRFYGDDPRDDHTVDYRLDEPERRDAAAVRP